MSGNRDRTISVVLNVHREGALVLPSLASIAAAVAVAEARGFDVEVLAVADRPDAATRDALAGWKGCPLRVLEVDNGDLGRSRNDGVAAACGTWIGFLDGDDLWSSDWLAAAAEADLAGGAPTVWHPEVNLYFGARPALMRHPDWDEPGFDLAGLVEKNFWTALSFARRAVYLATPYRANELANGLGYEDWSWNMATIAAGCRHKIVPGTSHAVRQKANSLGGETKRVAALPHPSDFADLLRAPRR